jgi:xylan 1,4-beta-xylosidase
MITNPIIPGFHLLARGESKFLSTEVSGRFTGLYAALYCAGAADGSSRDRRASFAWMDYKELSRK